MSVADKSWETVQKKVFTKWCNSHLKKKGTSIENIEEDFKNGVRLIQLYEAIADESLGKFYATPKMRIHEIANLRQVLSKINAFIHKIGIKVEFSAEQVNEGDMRQTLGLIWCLILRFEIADISEDELSAKEGLLLWCQKKTADHAAGKVEGPQMNKITNFSTSWQDGLAFCALIHKHRPDLLDYSQLDKANAMDNLNLAFRVAEEQLDIPQLLDATDMVGDIKPDEKATMTYVSYFWKRFASSQKQDIAGKTISRSAARARELAAMQSDYERRARELLAWIAASRERLGDTSPEHFGFSLASVIPVAADFKSFKDTEKPVKLGEKLDLEVLLSTLRSQLKSAGLPMYTPPEELSTASIDESWNALSDTQTTYERALNERVQLMKRLELLLSRLQSRVDYASGWAQSKTEALEASAEDHKRFASDVAALQARLKIQESFADEQSAVQRSIDEARAFASEIEAGKHEQAATVGESLASLDESMQNLAQRAKEHEDALRSALEKAEELQTKCLEFSRVAERLNLTLEEASLALSEQIAASSKADVEAYDAAYAKVKAELDASAAPALDTLRTLHSEITEGGADPSTYSSRDVDALQAKYDSVTQQYASQETELSTERERQSKHAELLENYEEKSTSFTALVEQGKQRLEQEDQAGESLEARESALRALSSELDASAEEQFQQAKQAYAQLEEADIAEKAQTAMQSLQVARDSLHNAAKKRIEAVQNEMLASKSASISEEQLAEFRTSFNHFDKDKSGGLRKLEFKSALYAMDIELSDAEVDRTFAELDTDNSGAITFDEYLNFMIKQVQQGQSVDDVRRAFETLANGNKSLTEAQLRSGNLPEEDVAYLTEAMPKLEDGTYDYNAYLQQVYGQ